MLKNKLLSALSGSESVLFSDDVFATVVRTGTGATATITTGFQPDLLISKSRGNEGGAWPWAWVDSARGINAFLSSNQTDGNQVCTGDIGSFGATGYTLNAPSNTNNFNRNGTTYVNYAFAKKAKFFDCGTYTGNGVAGRQIPHSLGVAPGMVIVKSTSLTQNWLVWHRSLTSSSWYLTLNQTNAAADSGGSIFGGTPSASSFQIDGLNTNGATYVWYALAHDTSAEGIIQCGSYTGNGGATNTINLGREVQFALIKKSSATGGWVMLDMMRGMSPPSAYCQFLEANTSSAEGNTNAPYPVAVGFEAGGTNYNDSGATYIYIAIRRPNKPPTTGTQVYNAIARTGTGAAATVTGVGFAPDLYISKSTNNSIDPTWYDRLRGNGNELHSNNTNAELYRSDEQKTFTNDGVTLGGGGWQYVNWAGWNYINHFFKRAPGVFDVVAYTGTGSARTVNHSLGAVPELMIVKSRSNNPTSWVVYSSALGASKAIYLNLSIAAETADSTYWNTSAPTSIVFSLGTLADINGSSRTYIAYLFATSPGISKVGSYTGNGSSQTIDCGFSAGARFILIKRIDAASDWFLWDSARGIIAGNDPTLWLNSTSAEDSSVDRIDPHASGFVINEVGSNTNTSGGTYIYLAFA